MSSGAATRPERDRFCVGVIQRLCLRSQRENASYTFSRLSGEPPPQITVVVETNDPVAQRRRIVRWDEDACLEMLDLLRDASDGGRNDRHACGHRLERTERKCLLARREHEHTPSRQIVGCRTAAEQLQLLAKLRRGSRRLYPAVEVVVSPEAGRPDVLEPKLRSSSKCKPRGFEEDISPLRTADVADRSDDERFAVSPR